MSAAWMNVWKRVLYAPPDLGLLERHAGLARQLVEELARDLAAYAQGEAVQYEEAVRLERDADRLKQLLRGQLPRSDLMLPVARSDLLDLLWEQDQIADDCQDAIGLMSLLPVSLPPALQDGLRASAGILLTGIDAYTRTIARLVEMLKRAFDQTSIRELWALAEVLDGIEHDADLADMALIRSIYGEPTLDAFAKYHLIQVALKVGAVTDHMQNAGDRLRVMTAR